jgi:hypothetical protein
MIESRRLFDLWRPRQHVASAQEIQGEFFHDRDPTLGELGDEELRRRLNRIILGRTDVPPPQLGESTAPLTDDQVAVLVDLVRTDRREDYDFLCSALGVTNGPELWAGVKRRVP